MKFSQKNLSSSHQAPWLVVDLVMLGLLTINLILILFDSLFATAALKQALYTHLPEVAKNYQFVHDNFLLLDLIFIGIFLTEFVIRWGFSVRNKEYMRWYFFPFIHWYDLVGCIPLDGARILRILRVFSILYRLHKYRIVDLRSTGLYRFLSFYYDVFIEEVSDRIVIKVVSDIQKEVKNSSGLVDRITGEVLAPRKVLLHHWLASLSGHMGDSIADPDVGASVRNHVTDSVAKAVRSNPQVHSLTLVPVIGSSVERLLETAVSDIVVQAIVNMLKDMTPQRVNDIMEHGLTAPSLTERKLNTEVLSMVHESLELVKKHVAIQQWKQKLE